MQVERERDDDLNTAGVAMLSFRHGFGSLRAQLCLSFFFPTPLSPPLLLLFSFTLIVSMRSRFWNIRSSHPNSGCQAVSTAFHAPNTGHRDLAGLCLRGTVGLEWTRSRFSKARRWGEAMPCLARGEAMPCLARLKT